jgi:predicted nucleic acid-binding protein
MGIIIDVNIALKFFFDHEKSDWMEAYNAIINGRCCLHYGGKLIEEYQKLSSVWKIILQLDRAGRAKLAPKQIVEKETKYLIQKSACISNDYHIIALARVSGARLLCSDDVKLGEDFKNKKWIDKPRGKIYKNATHKKLLKKRCNKC